MRRHIIRPRRLWGFQMHAERIKISIPVSIKTCMTPITLWLQGIDDDRVFAVTHARLRLGRENDWGMRDEVWGAVFGMQSMRSRLFLMRCAVDGVSGEIVCVSFRRMVGNMVICSGLVSCPARRAENTTRETMPLFSSTRD
jgi:hypothetical protein